MMMTMFCQRGVASLELASAVLLCLQSKPHAKEQGEAQ